MNCKQCGQQIRREHKREDGKYVCPGCGKIYRVKQSAPSPQKSVKKPVRKKTNRMVYIIAAAVVLAALAVILCASPGGREDKIAEPEVSATPAPTPIATATPVPTPEPKRIIVTGQPASVHFRAVGDVMSHKLQLTHAEVSRGVYNYDSQFMYVKEALSKADYTIANLETSISVGEEYTSYPRFKTPEAILDTLKDCGVDMLTMANNHILDDFYQGLKKTVDEAEERGFDHLGAYRTAEEAEELMIKDIGGIRFGFLAYTTYVNENEKRLDSATRAFAVNILQEADLEADVKALRDVGAEVVICLPHWGVENKRSVASETREWARRMVEAGVDIILGSHPHVVHPIDVGEMEVDGETKDILIAWSMGNFISYMANQYMDSGIIVDFTVSRDEDGNISIDNVGYVPVYVAGSKEYFHLLCSGDFYYSKPESMSSSDFKRMRASVKEIAEMIGQDGITMLQN